MLLPDYSFFLYFRPTNIMFCNINKALESGLTQHLLFLPNLVRYKIRQVFFFYRKKLP